MSETPRTVTVAVESDSSPTRIAELLADLSRLPEWAPALAERVERMHDGRWRAVSGDRSVVVTATTDTRTGVVDILADLGDGDPQGARFRAMPRPGGGAVVTMTMPAVEGGPDSSRAVAERELAAAVALAE